MDEHPLIFLHTHVTLIGVKTWLDVNLILFLLIYHVGPN